jgi:hypothetical protein
MPESLASRSQEELLEVGGRICRCHDERWVALWAYNMHRLFRSQYAECDVWARLDDLIRREYDWHLGRQLFDDIRQVTLAAEKRGVESGEYAFLRLGEITAKCISNASWKPGLFDVNAPYHVPALAFEIARALGDNRQSDWLNYHFMSLFQHEDSKKRNG